MSTVSDDIQKALLGKLQTDSEAKMILKKIRNGEGDYSDAEKYADRAGQLLTEVLQAHITADNFPVGSVDEIAGLIVPALELNHKVVTQVAGEVQKSLNSNGRIGMNPVTSKFDRHAAYNLVGRTASYETFEDAAFMFDAPIREATKAYADDTLKSNADFQYKSGLRPKIVRTAESDACDWCVDLEGEYDYEEVRDRNNPVFQRHNNCQCEITYEPGDGRVQDVRTKQWYNEDESNTRVFRSKEKEKKDAIEAKRNTNNRIQNSQNDNFGSNGNSIKLPPGMKDVTKIYYSEASPKKGNIDTTSGYDKEKYVNETNVSKLIFERFGGDIVLLEPFPASDQRKRADYLWNQTFWELKTCSTAKATDKAVRQALKQISENPGGIILDINKNVVLQDAINTINRRLNKSMQQYTSVDVMIIQNGKIEKILSKRK